ncbi:MAG: hemerythrin domain-containing protein [Chroococcidiopsidaceae cyanobacterium CP_BM_ER_R8_30]|nr:hemerythrin domain-containing protein [Chroococcidiopsidaceae cyanobacterium CP_BM_ER_R8_30]
MVTTLDDTKRSAIAVKLANVKAIQNLLISSEQTLLQESTDQDINSRLRDMLGDDQKNLGVLDTVIVQYGVQGEPKETTKQLIEMTQKLMSGSELTLYEKFAQLELFKHGQVMAGIVIHKAAQQVGADVEAAITPLNTINFENRAHQEQLKGVLEILGTRELTGKDADQGIWARVQDAMAALTGAVGSAVTQVSDKKDMNIQDVLRMDHTKVNTLFMELNGTNDPQKIQEYFGQIYKDLTAHSLAEEEVVYPAVRPYYSETQDLYNEQGEIKEMLEEIKAISPSSPEFKNKVNQLKDVVMHHVRQEESDVFAKVRENFSDEQSEQLATKFKSAKSKIQEEMGVAKK